MKTNITESVEKRSNAYFKNTNKEKLYQSLFKLLWYSTLSCSNLPGLSNNFMIKSCELGGKNFECSKIFSKVPTDSGMCCGLNIESNLKKSKYSNLVKEMQESKQITDFRRKHQFPVSV